MNDIGFPAQSRQSAIARQIAQLREQVNRTTDEAVTGRIGDIARARNGQVSEAFALDKALGDLGRYNQIIALSETRASVIQTSLGSVTSISLSVSVTTQTVLQSNGGGSFGLISIEARQSLTAVIGQLNVSSGGRSLFAGDAGDRGALAGIDDFLATVTPILEAGPDVATAFAALDTVFFAAGGVFETALYTGGSNDAPATEIAPGERVNYAVRADERALRETLKNLSVLAAAFDPNNAIPPGLRRDYAEQANNGLRNVSDDLAEVSARVGTAQGRIAEVRARNVAEETALTRSFNDIAGRDQFEAIAELETLEGQLESLFLTTARLSSLSLTNFLR